VGTIPKSNTKNVSQLVRG